jgi:ATPase subunit of ABC transporter with duplicated ATPase domains
MRMVAKRMREKAEELEEERWMSAKKTKPSGRLLSRFRRAHRRNTASHSLNVKNHKVVERKTDISLRKNNHLLAWQAPTASAKARCLKRSQRHEPKGMTLGKDVRIGYYRQDFSNLDFDKTVYQELAAVVHRPIEEDIRALAAGFFNGGRGFQSKIGTLSEGQKGLGSFCAPSAHAAQGFYTRRADQPY